MKNSLSDLNNYLFAQMERLNGEELDDEKFEKELKRSNATRDIAQMIIENARVHMQSVELASKYLGGDGSEKSRHGSCGTAWDKLW